MNRPSKPNLLAAMISASISLALTGQSATAEQKIFPFSPVLYTNPTGAAAQCRFHILNNASSMLCNIIDTKVDGHDPFIEWEAQDFGTVTRVYYRGDEHTVEQIQGRRVERGTIRRFKWKVCVDRGTFGRDYCSPTRYETMP